MAEEIRFISEAIVWTVTVRFSLEHLFWNKWKKKPPDLHQVAFA
ncbi:MAG TPA: hypothetical protein VIK59_06255 [Verrucomicrobiae bacterium]